MAGVTRAERRRARIEGLVLADPARSNRDIAREVRCSHHTVARVRAGLPGLVPAGACPAEVGSGQHPGSGNLIEPAGPGNGRAVTHGAYSEARRRPLEDEHREQLRRLHPDAPDDLLNLRARRLALIDLFAAHVSDAGPVRGKGDVVPAAAELRRLLDSEERAAISMHERERESRGAGLLAGIEAEYADSDESEVVE